MSLASIIKGRRGASGFGYASTAAEVTAGLDLHGKNILITGVNSGLGRESARALSQRGARIFGAARSREKAAEVVSEPSDLELFALWRAGDNGAGSALIKRHFATLHRFFATKARGHEEDLIQTTFVACVEARDAFRGEASFRTYLFRIARLELFTHYRKRYRSSDIDFTITSIRDLGTSPSAALLRCQERELLEQALQQIALDQRIALELTYWEELAAPDIASVLGIPENTVYSRLRRAKGHLREALARLSDVAEERSRAQALLLPDD